MNNKLPVTSIFLEAILLPYKHYRRLIKVGFPLIISGVLLIALVYFYSGSENTTQLIVLSGGVTIALCISLVMAIVGCHRIFLLKTSLEESAKLFNWTGNEIKYAGWWIFIWLCVALIAIPFSLIFIPFINSLASNVHENEIILYSLLGIINIPLFYFVSRWSLVLPSSAIDIHGKSLTWSWRITEGNGWRLTLLIGILPFILDIIFKLLPAYESIGYTLIYYAVWLVVGVIEIGLLSLSYAFLAPGDDSEIVTTAEK